MSHDIPGPGINQSNSPIFCDPKHVTVRRKSVLAATFHSAINLYCDIFTLHIILTKEDVV